MGLFGNLFSKKKTFHEVITKTSNEIFSLYRVNNPTDAEKMKSSFYLCIAGMAMFNDAVGGALAAVQIDKLILQTKEMTESLNFRVGDIAADQSDVDVLLSDFPPQIKADERTKINGLAGFEALYFSKGQLLMGKIMNTKGGPLGLVGIASVVVVDGIFGENKSRDHFMENVAIISNFNKELFSSV